MTNLNQVDSSTNCAVIEYNLLLFMDDKSRPQMMRSHADLNRDRWIQSPEC